jgi:small subunit ribosomal protein S16
LHRLSRKGQLGIYNQLNQHSMATKIRLQRHGRKGYAYYHIVVADSRAPRDGKFIERIGSYNPNTNPATIDLNFDRALYWINTGAQPTDTTRNILSDEGVLLMKHLQGGVKKGAFDEAEAQKRFQAWKSARIASINAVKEKTVAESKEMAKKRHEEEAAKNQAKAAALAKKQAEESAALAAKAVEAAQEAAAAETTPPVAE